MTAPAPRRWMGAAVGGLLLGSVALWALVIFGSARKTPGWEGLLTGVFAGGFLALLTFAGGMWLLVSALSPRWREDPAPPSALPSDLASTLAELEAARASTIRRINLSALWRVPLGVAAAYAVWIWVRDHGRNQDPEDVWGFLLVGAFGGYCWAAQSLSEAYRRLYKQRVLPRLASQFGELAWRPARPPLDEFRRHGLFDAWDRCKAEDEIYGRYRGLEVSIIELRLSRGSGKNERTVFHGLTATVALPRGLRGVTVVAPDRGVFGNFAERLRGGPCERVSIEDPMFEKAYEVYGTDQISARALLTPAFMQRFMTLADSGRFGAPVALVQDNRLLMALATRNGRDLFEPPSYLKPAASREALSQLTADLEGVLRAADAVIDLDQAARRQPVA